MRVKFLKCAKCNQIEPLSAWYRDENGLTKCSHCNHWGEVLHWPGKEVTELLDLINNFDKTSPQFNKIACVFVSSALELLLEELLTLMLYWDLLYEEISMYVDTLLDAFSGRSRMLDLYKRFGHGSFHKEVNDLGEKDFLKNWDNIAKARNEILHGNKVKGTSFTPQFFEETFNKALMVFYQLHNRYNKESLSYKSATQQTHK